MPQPDGEDRVVVVGAGIAGLSAARALAAAGRSVVVLERARGVGGRCATRRIEGGQPVDFGVAFLHGREPEFLAALAEVPGSALPGWPSDVHGRGLPCQPEAFAVAERRVAFVDGVAAFPRHLATGLDVPQASSSGPLRGDGRDATAAPEAWITALLAEAARLLGPWAATPSFVQGHRWTHARTERGSALHAPILLRLPSDAPPGPRVGLAGELFFPGGGASAAWMSGVQLARLVLAEER